MLTLPTVLFLGLALSAHPVDWKQILGPGCTVRPGTDTKEGRLFVVHCTSEPGSRLYQVDRSAENGAIEVDRSPTSYGNFVPTDDLLYFSTWEEGLQVNWQGRVWNGRLSKRRSDVPGRVIAVMNRRIYSEEDVDGAIGLYATPVDGGRPRLLQATQGGRTRGQLVRTRSGSLVYAISLEGNRYRYSKADRGPVALQLWSTDGHDVLPVTQLLSGKDEINHLEESVAGGGRLYTPAEARDTHRWGVTVTDGDSRWWLQFAGEEPAPRTIDRVVPVGDSVFVLQRRSVHALEVWYSRNGRQASLAAEIPVREQRGYWDPPSLLRQFAGCGKLWMVVSGQGGPQLWMSDGTQDGTRRVLSTEEVSAGLGEPFVAEPLECIDGTLIIERIARQGRSLATVDVATGRLGQQLWRTEERS